MAASASVRATTRVGTSAMSAARRAAVNVRMNWSVGTSTLPPRWPHFFSLASWSSQWTPAAPASIMPFISSNALREPPKPASASARIGAIQSGARPFAGGPGDLVGTLQRVVDAAHDLRHGVGGVERLVGVGLAGDVGVGRHLPAGQVDRLQPGLDHLDGLATGQRAQRVDVFGVVDQLPEALGSRTGDRMLDVERTLQPDHVLGGVRALDALPPRIGRSTAARGPPPVRGSAARSPLSSPVAPLVRSVA